MTSARAPGPSPARLGLGRPAVLISLGLHVLFFVLTLGVPRLLASSAKPTPVYVVDLVSLGSGGPSGSPPPPAAAPKPPAAAPKPAKPATPPPRPKKAPEKAIVLPERGAKKTPPKETKKPPVKPEPKAEPAAAEEEGDESQTAETPSPAAPQEAVKSGPAAAGAGTASGAPGGVPGSTGSGVGQGSGTGGDAYDFYVALLTKSIKGAWKRPLYTGQNVLEATVRLEISRSGRVVKLDLVTSSGLDVLDRSVLRAVRDAEPFPPLPTALTVETLVVPIVFELKPEASGTGPAGE